MEFITGQTYQEERSLYGKDHLNLEGCRFAGEKDGESPLKECDNINATGCYFGLRYPFWHNSDAIVMNSLFDEKARAPFWYDHGLKLMECQIKSVKALRESYDILTSNCTITSDEYAWKCHHIQSIKDNITSVYPFFMSEDVTALQITLTGKYSFQYVKKGSIRQCELHTKDAFWHSEDVTVIDSTLDGEFLGWYSKNLHLVRCKIIGHQPLCYCQGLVLEDCEMEGCDLAFEYSDVKAIVKSHIDSVKWPLSGYIRAASIGEVIRDGSKHDILCRIFDDEKLKAEGGEESLKGLPGSDGL